MKKLGLLGILLFWALSSCSTPALSDSKPVGIVDALGRKVLLPDHPQRIVIAGKQTPMLVNFFYLFKTAGEKIIAIERRSQSSDDFLKVIDPEIEAKYVLEKDAGVEQIAPLNPDVVILKSSMRDSVGLGLEAIEIPVIYVEFESVEQIYRDMKIIASVLNEMQRGNFLIEKFSGYETLIDQKITLAVDHPSVLMLQAQGAGDEKSFSVPSARWLQTAMIEDLGAEAVWKDAAQSGGWTTINIEQVLNWDADIFFVINYQGQSLAAVDALSKDSLWREATTPETIFAFPNDYLSWDQPDPRWILGYAWMASRLYPDQFSPHEALDMVKSFYSEFYGFDGNDFNQVVMPKIRPYFE